MYCVNLLFSFLALSTASFLDEVSQQPLGGQASSNPALTYIPPIGLGTWLSEPEKASGAVHAALNAGYRHIDAAAIYRNEPSVGRGLAASNLPRQNYWVTSKLWNDAHRPSDVRPALQKTLSDLNIPYLDLYLMHWPVAFDPDSSKPRVDKSVNITQTWAAMEELVHEGLTKNIGVSNFAPADLKAILDMCVVCPAAHEFETHPYLQQQSFVNWHLKHGIQVIAYSPFANLNPVYGSDLPSILEDDFWLNLADSKGVTVPQAILAWGMQRGTVVIPKSVHEDRIVENWGSNYIRFTEGEMESIAAADKKVRLNDPGDSWGKKLFEGLDG
ncbi:MAG: hypothetical protein Q9227_004664 [Pyrenula ochraceoflavens]